MAELIIQYGKLSGRRLSLPAGEIFVGRDEGCQIRMASSDISRRHCVLRTSDAGIVVQDLESRNGTFVNDVAVAGEVSLKAGDVLRIGPIVFQVPPAAAPAEPVPQVVETARKERQPVAAAAELHPPQVTAALKTNPSKKGPKKASDDDIASWLSEDDSDDSASPSDTTIIPGKPKPKTEAVAAPPEPKVEKKVFHTVREEAADIIRRHHEMLRKKRAGE